MLRVLRVRQATRCLGSVPPVFQQPPISCRSPSFLPRPSPHSSSHLGVGTTQVVRWHGDKLEPPEIGEVEIPPKFDFGSTPELFAELETERQMEEDKNIDPDELSEEDREIYEIRKQFDAWFEGLSERTQVQFVTLWGRPHVRYAVKEMIRDPEMYPRFINNKDVVKFLEIIDIRPWEQVSNVPTPGSEYTPQGQDFPQKVVFPDRIVRLRDIDEWGTYIDPVLVPTKLRERIVECLGYCVPSAEGNSKIWVMKPGETCVCDQCLQYFHCFNENVYSPGYEEEDEYTEVLPRTDPIERVEEWMANRRQKEQEDLERMTVARETTRRVHNEIKKLFKEIRQNIPKGSRENDARYKKIEDLKKETFEAQENGGNSFDIWSAKRKSRSRTTNDQRMFNKLVVQIKKEEEEERARKKEEQEEEERENSRKRLEE